MVGFLIIVFGVFLVGLLTGVLWWDSRKRESYVPPKPEEQPHAPDHREHIEEVREEDEDSFPVGERLLPYNMHTHSSHSTGKGREERPQHGRNVGGGAFGSGSLGG
jgi:FtsZ-interacting cell division protein ZipA